MPTPKRGLRVRPVLWALTALAGLALALLAGLRLGRADPPKYHQLTFLRGTIWSARFGSNGQTVVYGAAWNGKPFHLFTTTLTGPESRSLDLPDADILSVSASGEMAISLGRHFDTVFNTKGTLAEVSLSGGAPRPILEDVEWADWMPDGKSLAVVRGVAGKSRLECPIGRVLYETPGLISDIRVSPDGERIAFMDRPTPLSLDGSVAVVDRIGHKVALAEAANWGGLAWSPRGDEVWFTSVTRGSEAIEAVSLSGKRRLVARVPGGLTLHDVSRDGRVLIGRDNRRIVMMGVLRGESAEKDLSWFAGSNVRDISRDGRTVLFFEAFGGPWAVYVGRADGSTPVRLGEGAAFGLSPDAVRALVTVPNPPPPHLVIYPVGPGEPQSLPAGSANYSWASWFPDGKRILATGVEPGHGRRLYVQDLAGGPARVISGDGATFSWDALSPDGRWAAVRSPDGGVSLYPVDGGTPRSIPGLAAADDPIAWSEDGLSLYFFRRSELPARVERVDVATGRRQPWKQLMPPDPTGITGIIRIRITPDGQYYAYSSQRILSELYLAEGLK